MSIRLANVKSPGLVRVRAGEAHYLTAMNSYVNDPVCHCQFSIISTVTNLLDSMPTPPTIGGVPVNRGYFISPAPFPEEKN